jgi:hypothetical protein
MLNVTDSEVFATFSTDESGWHFFDMMYRFQIDLVPEFLQGATINTTYSLQGIPWLFEAIGKPIPESKWIDYFIETENKDPELFQERCYSSLDSAEIILDLIPLENMVWASDYIEGFIEETPEVK